MITNPKTLEENFGEREEMLITACAKEAVGVFNQISDLRQKSSGLLLVIANKRYGEDFVIKPLQQKLKNLNETVVVSEYVRSTDLDYKMDIIPSLSSEATIIIQHNRPLVAIVDGTSCSRIHEMDGILEGAIKKYARFPSAFRGYINYFDQHFPGEYRLKFWTPQMTPSFFIGWSRRRAEEEVLANIPINSQRNSQDIVPKPVAYFISATAPIEAGGSNGAFDDPEHYPLNRNCPVVAFVEEIQRRITKKIPELA